MFAIGYECEQCRTYVKTEVFEGQTVHCPQCAHPWGVIDNTLNVFEQCQHCQCRQFYSQKDFNQALGCLILLIGIVLVPFTKGISLPVFWLMDLYLHRRVKAMVICYQCGTEYRGFSIPSSLKSFMHHIGVKYDNKHKKSQKLKRIEKNRKD